MNIPEVFYTIDVAFAGFVLLFAVGGLLRGLAGELARVVTLLVLLSGICFFYPAISQCAARNWSLLSPAAVQVTVFLTLFIGSLALVFLLGKLFRHFFEARVGIFTNRVAGSVVGLFRGLLIGVSLLAALSLLPGDRVYRVLSEKSVIGSWVCNRFTPWLYPRLMELPVFDQKEN